jgi:integrase
MSAAGPSARPPFTSPLAAELTRFLAFKRAAGYRYREEARALRGLDRCLAEHLPPADPVITLDLVRAYVACRGSESETTRGPRLSLLRQVCRFLALEEPRTALPPRGFLGIHPRPCVPRGLTREEGRRFLRACAGLPAAQGSPLRGVVHGTALTRLYLTGLRAGEAGRLALADVDLAHGLLQIRGAKFGKSRLVPLAPDLTVRLARCRAAVEAHFGPRAPEAPFFPGPAGRPCAVPAFRYSLRKVLAAAGIARWSGGQRLGLHSLRHAFAVHRLLLWYEQGPIWGRSSPCSRPTSATSGSPARSAISS